MAEISTDISVQTNQGLNQRTDPGIGKSVGNFNQVQVQVIDQDSLIQNAAEELTSSLSEEEEKDVSEREVEGGKKSDSLERILQINEMQELLSKLGDLNKRDLSRAIKALLQQQSNNPGEIRERAREQFEEPAHQYVALKALAETLKERGAPEEQIAAVNGAVDQLMEEEGPSVRAALNIGETANNFSKDDLGDPKTLRDAYRTNILDYVSATAVLNDLIERFGEDNIANSIQFVNKALAADLEAGGPSIDKTKLNLILNDMYRLKTMSTVLGNCDILVENAQKNGARASFTPINLLREIVPFQDAQRIVSDQISTIPEKAGLTELGPQINFLNDLQELARLIPTESFTAKEEGHDKLMVAIQDSLDEKIKLEEELEEEYEDDEEDEIE